MKFLATPLISRSTKCSPQGKNDRITDPILVFRSFKPGRCDGITVTNFWGQIGQIATHLHSVIGFEEEDRYTNVRVNSGDNSCASCRNLVRFRPQTSSLRASTVHRRRRSSL